MFKIIVETDKIKFKTKDLEDEDIYGYIDAILASLRATTFLDTTIYDGFKYAIQDLEEYAEINTKILEEDTQ